MFRVLFIFFILSFSSQLLAEKDCLRTRAAFDIGSGATRMTVAKINICKGRIIKILKEAEEPVFYKRTLDISSNKMFNKKVMEAGLNSIKKLKNLARPFNPHHFVGVATQAFREARNGKEFIKTLSHELNMKIYIIPQKKEAIIGFLSALSVVKVDGAKLLVWDIGGGSMQLTGLNSKYQYLVHLDKLGSLNFKNLVIESIKGKNHKKVTTPNPIGKKGHNLSYRLAKQYAHFQTPNDFLKKGSNSQIVGIGGVLFWSVRSMLKKKKSQSFFTRDEILKSIKKFRKYSDKKIGGKYASTNVSNLILILGYMDAMGVTKVKTLNLNMSHGILIDKDFWVN